MSRQAFLWLMECALADGVCVGVRACVTILVLLCAVREALVMKAYPEFAVLGRYCEATIPAGGNTVCLWLGVRFIFKLALRD